VAQFTDKPSPGRPAGKLFKQDRTLLILRPTGPVVINATHYADFDSLSDHSEILFAVDCGKVCQEVDEAISKLK
jgi:hypothetical protein